MHHYLKAALWMSGAIVSFMAMAVAGRIASAELDTFEIMTYRSLIGLVVMTLVLTVSRRWQDISRQDQGLHAVRNAAHFMGQNLWFFALTLMPLAQLFAFEFTTPIWVILLSPLLLGTQLRKAGLFAALIAFVGILIVARPGAAPVGPGLFAALGCAVGFALAFVFTKILLKRHSVFAILFYLTLYQSVFSLIFAGYDGQIALPSPALYGSILVISITGLAAHYCIATALTLAPASVVAPVDFVRLPAIAVVGALLYNEPFDVIVIFGAALIFAGNYLNIISEIRNSGPE